MWQCMIYGWLHFLFLITGVFGCIIVLHPVCTYHSTNTPWCIFQFCFFFYFSALHEHSMRIIHYHDLEKSVLFNCTKWLILRPKLPNESLKLQELISQQCSSFFFLLSLAGGWQERLSTKPIHCCVYCRVSILVNNAFPGQVISGLDLCNYINVVGKWVDSWYGTDSV